MPMQGNLPQFLWICGEAAKHLALGSKDSILPIRFLAGHKRKGATGFFGKLPSTFLPVGG